jgi:hypothetical protein
MELLWNTDAFCNNLLEPCSIRLKSFNSGILRRHRRCDIFTTTGSERVWGYHVGVGDLHFSRQVPFVGVPHRRQHCHSLQLHHRNSLYDEGKTEIEVYSGIMMDVLVDDSLSWLVIICNGWNQKD